MVIPAINAETFEEVEKKVHMLEGHTEWIHIDVADGKFTENTLWNSPEDLKQLHTRAKIEVHLMIDHPEEVIREWIAAGAHRIIVHIESTDAMDDIIHACKEAGVEIALALKPETPPDLVDLYTNDITFVQCLAVHPGRAGQEFQEPVYDKIRIIRERFPALPIEVDGGVKVGVARKAKEAGATLFVAASAVFDAEDPPAALDVLRRDVE